jgi:hypothetical protein
MKKIISLMLIAACIGVMSCKKELMDNDSLNDVSSVNTLNASSKTFKTNFGVLPNDLSLDDRVTVAHKLNVGYVRDAIVLKNFNGKSNVVDEYLDNGFKVLLNLNYDQQDHFDNGDKKPRPFPTDMKEYKKLLNNVLDVYHPEIAVIENEPFNDNHYKGPIENYFTELSTAIEVCHKRGIKVADGGLNPQRVRILVYQNYVNNGQQKKADDFAARALTDFDLRIAQGKANKDPESKLDETREMVERYATMDLDYVNIHWYEPIKDDIDQSVTSDGVLQEVADYLRAATGHPVITNEFGQDNEIPTLVSSQVDAFTTAGFKYAVDFSGKGASGSVSLTKGTELKSNGKAYKYKVSKNK